MECKYESRPGVEKPSYGTLNAGDTFRWFG